ncbi:hypothetical protein DXG03_008435 [Asterophora parasitica]|uniref:Uncharacterized protein n=1 Tax=Asterophora parasitica TaxID=117018 RepID=A0A9P7GIP0_9AGAR|nr:hypothetical protein DXG03_008435 [Asterophora parasitica]
MLGPSADGIPDNDLSVIPTKEWQDNLSSQLASNSKLSSSSYDASTFPRRRRLESITGDVHSHPNWNEMYTIDTEEEEFQDATDGIGELSLDENQEVRYHGKASGLHLLGRNIRTDDRIEGGIWFVVPISVCDSSSNPDSYPGDCQWQEFGRPPRCDEAFQNTTSIFRYRRYTFKTDC